MAFLMIYSIILSGCASQQKIQNCEKPHIPAGNGCCLDENSNSICDYDEQSEPNTPKIKQIQTPVQDIEPTVENPPQAESLIEEKGTKEESENFKKVETYDVRILGRKGFDPMELTIKVGDWVRWINNDRTSAILIVYKDGSLYLSPTLLPKREFEHEFTDVGEYEYWWNIAHSSQPAKINVKK